MNTAEFNGSSADRNLGCCPFALVADAKMCHPEMPSGKGLLSSCRQCGQKEPAAELLWGPPELPHPLPEQFAPCDPTEQEFRGQAICSRSGTIPISEWERTMFAPEVPAKLA